jgi:hypothetical protein
LKPSQARPCATRLACSSCFCLSKNLARLTRKLQQHSLDLICALNLYLIEASSHNDRLIASPGDAAGPLIECSLHLASMAGGDPSMEDLNHRAGYYRLPNMHTLANERASGLIGEKVARGVDGCRQREERCVTVTPPQLVFRLTQWIFS